MARIVLFDLDGTVLTFQGPPPGPGRTSMNRMMRELFGLDDGSTGVPFAGSTDKTILRALLEKADVAMEPSTVDRALEVYLHHLEDEMTRRPYVPIGDVLGTVAACSARGACLGVATGNVRKGAAIKLGSAGLGHAFDLDRGGYGCDAEPRAEILGHAIARCGGGRDVVVVGDTLHDVSAARAVGAKVVGLAHDGHGRAELETAGADAIVETCGPALVEAIFSV